MGQKVTTTKVARKRTFLRPRIISSSNLLRNKQVTNCLPMIMTTDFSLQRILVEDPIISMKITTKSMKAKKWMDKNIIWVLNLQVTTDQVFSSNKPMKTMKLKKMKMMTKWLLTLDKPKWHFSNNELVKSLLTQPLLRTLNTSLWSVTIWAWRWPMMASLCRWSCVSASSATCSSVRRNMSDAQGELLECLQATWSRLLRHNVMRRLTHKMYKWQPCLKGSNL